MGKRIVILGGGESGTGAALLAKARGYDVFVSDFGKLSPHYKDLLEEHDIVYEEGKHTEKLILNAKEVIKSPGIPFESPVVMKLLEQGIPVIDELEFASRHTKAKIIAITGTNGKTTTTLLTYHLLKEAGFNVGIAGNIGQSMAKQLVDEDFDYFVVEVSSFQLDALETFKADIGILLNITPDHLNRYNDKLENYVDSKFRITRNMDRDCSFIYFANDPIVAEEVLRRDITGRLYEVSVKEKTKRGSSLVDGDMVFKLLNNEFSIPQEDTNLKGPHNAVDMMAASIAAFLCGVDMKAIKKGLATYKSAPHRMEYVATINDVDFINDSKATNVDAVKYAMESFDEPLVWIAGGVDKGNDYQLLMEQVNQKVKALVCLGLDNQKLRDAFHDQIIDLLETDNMQSAVESALEYADLNDVVLLSPACASFDLFKNYEDRGEQFKQAVLALKKKMEDNKHINQ